MSVACLSLSYWRVILQRSSAACAQRAVGHGRRDLILATADEREHRWTDQRTTIQILPGHATDALHALPLGTVHLDERNHIARNVLAAGAFLDFSIAASSKWPASTKSWS